jgi:hypothetical protein
MNKVIILEQIKTSIDAMSKYHQLEILKIFVSKECKLNENKSGVFINLSYLDDDMIDKLNQYIKYTQEQEVHLDTTEYQKQEYKSSLT